MLPVHLENKTAACVHKRPVPKLPAQSLGEYELLERDLLGGGNDMFCMCVRCAGCDPAVMSSLREPFFGFKLSACLIT